MRPQNWRPAPVKYMPRSALKVTSESSVNSLSEKTSPGRFSVRIALQPSAVLSCQAV